MPIKMIYLHDDIKCQIMTSQLMTSFTLKFYSFEFPIVLSFSKDFVKGVESRKIFSNISKDV